jgi:hypothetical protein
MQQQRYCPACNRELAPDEKLEAVEGQKAPPRPGMKPPTVTVMACGPCKTGFLSVLFLLYKHAPQAIVWPADDPRRP